MTEAVLAGKIYADLETTGKIIGYPDCILKAESNSTRLRYYNASPVVRFIGSNPNQLQIALLEKHTEVKAKVVAKRSLLQVT